MENWITDRPPTEADADLPGHVAMQCKPGGDTVAYVHWSYVGQNIPWRHTTTWRPLAPRTLPGSNGQWISGEVKPLESESSIDGEVVRREANGHTSYLRWYDVTSDHTWRPYHTHDPRPVVLATITTEPECPLPGKFASWIDGAILLPTADDADRDGHLNIRYNGSPAITSWQSIKAGNKWRPLPHLDPRPRT